MNDNEPDRETVAMVGVTTGAEKLFGAKRLILIAANGSRWTGTFKNGFEPNHFERVWVVGRRVGDRDFVDATFKRSLPCGKFEE